MLCGIMRKSNNFWALTEFELKLLNFEPKKLLAKMYALLLAKLPFVDNSRIRWGKDFRVKLLEGKWQFITQFNIPFSRNISREQI